MPDVRSAKAIVVNQKTGEIIYEKSAGSISSIASLTKLMTAMVILDSGVNLDQEIKVTKADIDRIKRTGSRIPIGSKLTRYELLEFALMASDNRAASALSRSYPTGRQGLVDAMNVKAKKLGMFSTNFRDPTGLHKGNTSTAIDLVKMAQAAYQYPLIRKMTTEPQGEINYGKRNYKIGFVNTNRLVRKGIWDIGLSKTGFIRESGRCLIMQAIVNNEPVIMVFLNSYGKLTRFADAKRVKKWMEKNYIRQSQMSRR
ncbi:MAG: serine hydrolase [Methylophilaceae bacterium]|nr:serine hydrolase [Methylophilaceae bacterium]MBL6728540.1 serine hydrolase [Methylophilaceae bacterium]